MKLTVLIATYRRPRHLLNCLDSLAGQTRLPEEIILVIRRDDTATAAALDGLDSAESGTCRLRRVEVAEPGIVAAENCGLVAASGDVVALVDDDATAHPEWAARLLDRYSDPAVAAVGGPAIDVRGGREILRRTRKPVMRLTWYGRHIGGAENVTSSVQHVDFLRGNNMSFRRELVTGFDPRLKPYWRAFEDDALLPISRSGRLVVFDPEVVVYHHGSEIQEGVSRNADPVAIHGGHHNNTYVMLKHAPPALLPVRLLYTVLVGDIHYPGLCLFLAKAVVRLRFAKTAGEALHAMRGKIDGVRTFLDWRHSRA